MFDPSRRVVVLIASGAFVCLLLGLATDVGLFGWSAAALAAIYLVIARIVQRTRETSP